MNIEKNKLFVNDIWENSIIPALKDYIRIPNKSPAYDPEWEKHGHMDAAIQLISDWCRNQKIENMTLDIVKLPGRTPVIFMEIPGNSDETVLLYGHLDKQPEMKGWDSDLDPWTPVMKGDKLYGRGAADDGYAAFAAIAAIQSVRTQQLSHARCVVLIEACEESGSYDLPFYIEALKDRIGKLDFIICLDSGAGTYDQLWITTSLRGLIGGMLSIDVLKKGIHSGTGSGMVPSCMLILRQLLSRIENESDGKILLPELSVEIPPPRLQQTKETAKILAENLCEDCHFHEGVQAVVSDPVEQLLNRTWRAGLAIVNAEGFPPPGNVGNVTLPSLKFKLSMRIPPTCDAEIAIKALKNKLEMNPPFHAKVHFEMGEYASGWNAPTEEPWLMNAVNNASQHYFGDTAKYLGEGGSIPFMGMLGKKYPKAQFLITGLLGPESNAHGPNEFLHIPTGKKLTACIAAILVNHAKRKK